MRPRPAPLRRLRLAALGSRPPCAVRAVLVALLLLVTGRRAAVTATPVGRAVLVVTPGRFPRGATRERPAARVRAG